MKKKENSLCLQVILTILVCTPSVLFGQSDKEFKGKIGKTYAESQEYRAPQQTAPEGAPNVIWILLDDLGFGATSGFGGLISTPTFDSLGNQGVRYSNFHTAAVCAPTRAALLTGRNHHKVHMGTFPHANLSPGFPGYDARMPSSAGTVAEYLREYGYSTYAVGKWHLTPDEETTNLGPFDRWPSGKGFDHFFGFFGGGTDQYKPDLIEDNQHVPHDGRHLNEQLIDKTISYLDYQRKHAPDKPFFIHLAPGATHSPHQVDEKWIAKYKGKFDKGWDVYRKQVFENQKRLGIIPADAKLPELGPLVKPWKQLSADEQRIYVRFMESFAGFLEYTDYEIGRLVTYLKENDAFDNTAIFLILGDNGGSKEGSPHGTIANEYKGQVSDSEQAYLELLKNNIDKIGTSETFSNYPLGWAQATNTPFTYWKTNANAEGATRNPLVVSYPDKLQGKQGWRLQYGHVIDLLPTTLDLIGIPAAKQIRGIEQDSIQGSSLINTLENATASGPRQTQYYYFLGSGAIYHNGWKAGFRPVKQTFITPYPSKLSAYSTDPVVWELFHVEKDFNEQYDLSAKYPEKLKELQELFDTEARKNNVYPLINSWDVVREPVKKILVD